MKDKFQRMVAKAPQNTGGGNSQSFASRSEGAQQTPIMRTDEGRGNNLGITYVSPMYHLGLTVLWKYVACMLLALVLGIGNVWAAEPNLAINTESQGTEDFVKAYEAEGITLSPSASFSSGVVQLGNTPSSYDQHYFEVLAGSAEIDSISFLISGNGSNKNIQAPLFGWAETATSNTADTYVLLDPKVVTANSYAAAQWFTYDLSKAKVKCARIYRATKNVSSADPEYTGSSTALGTAQTIKIYGLKVWLKAVCKEPAAPTELSCTAHTENSLTFGWTEASNASSYDVKLWTNSGCTGDPVASGNVTTTTSKTFTGLDASTTYYCKVQSKGDGTTYCTEGGITSALEQATDASSCAATIPGNISKGALTEGKITLTAAGYESKPATDEWYWQTAADGVDESNSGASFIVTAAGTYYVRSLYNNDCWSAAKSIEVTAEELLEHYDITYSTGEYGTGEIAGGEKVEGVDFTLSSEMFTRENYLQVGWTKTDGTDREYMIGGKYTTDAAQKFYPAWAEKDTYTFAATNAKTIAALQSEGWTFNSATFDADPVDTECYVNTVGAMNTAGLTAPHSNSMDDNAIAFAKNTDAYALFDLGYVTTVSSVTGTFYVGSSSARTFTIQYLGSDGTTVLHSTTVNHPASSNWGSDALNETKVVANVRYIKIKSVAEKSWLVMSAFSVTYGDLVTKYNVTFDKNDEGASGSQVTLKYAEGAEVTLPGCTFTAPTNMEFDAWTSTDVTISNNKFTMPGKDVVIKATWKSACALAPTVSATTLGTTSYTTQVVNCAGISVLGSAGCTISEYGFVYGTATAPTISDSKKALEGDYTVINTAFAETTLTGLAVNTKYYVRAYATNSFGTAYGEEISFTTLAPLGNVLVVANSAGQTSDAITAMRNAGFVVTVSAPNSSRDYSGYDLVVLDESLDGKNGVTEKEEGDIKGVNIPLLNLKSFFYNSGRWGWGTGNNGTANNEIAKIPTTYKNAQSHPIFAGLTITDGNIDLIDPAKTGNTLQTATGLVAGKEGYVLATVAGNAFIHELTPDQRGVTDAKYLMVAISNNAKDNLSADGELLIVNAAKYLVGTTAWEPQYYTVSFEAHGDADPSPLTGKTITLPIAANGTASLIGWFTEVTGGEKIGDAGDSYTPTADITLHAQWETVSTDTRIKALTYAIGAGTPVDIYEAGKNTFNVVLPYAKSYDAITVATTPNHGNASIKAGAVMTVSSLPGSATFTIVAQSEAEENYTVNFTKGPKDGVSIIKAIADATNQDIKAENLSGLYKKAGHIYTASSYKLDQKRYFMVQLEDGKNFQEGDVVEINVSSVNDCNGFTIYSNISGDDFADGDLIVDTHDKTGAAAKVSAGINKITLPSYAGSNKLYVARKNGADQYLNAGINQVEVYRAMMPVLTAISFDGVAAEKGTGNAFSATLPNGTVLADMTVVPTIVKNGEGGSAAPTVAWAWGPNTYRVTDKDGDYTDYTITLTEAAAPSAAPTITTQPADADYYEGATIAALEVGATGESLTYQWYLGSDPIDGATNATYTPTVTAIGSYVYHCVVTNTEAGHPATPLASSDATITIAEDPAAIKLLDGSTVNHTNFITGVTANETVEFQGGTVNYAKFSGTVSGVNGVKDLTRVIAYNATTNKTKIRIYAHNNSSSAHSILVKGLVEGADAATDLATIDLGNKEDKVSDWIEFNNAANRTIYIMVPSSAGDVYFTQVKVIESGETPMKQVGEAGYSLNLNKGRFFGIASTDLAFEGLNAKLSGDYTALNSSYAKLNATSMSFTVANPVLLKVTTNNNKTYYVTKGAAGKDNETAKTGVSEFDLTAGEWYITAGTADVQFTNLAFELPKCNLAISKQPVSNTNFGAGDMTATVVAASSTDGASLAYQWYDADDNEVAGATEATLTTTVEGTYYVIVTASKDGYESRSVQSDGATLGYRDLTIATLSALSYGGTAIALEADKYEYRVDLPEGTTEVPVLAATATQAAYGATAVPTDAAAFDNYEAISTVLVTAENGTTQQTYTVHFYVDHEILALVDVTGDMTWDFSKANDGSATGTSPCNEEIFANVAGIVNNSDFESDNLMVTANKFANGKLQGSMIKFHTTVDGMIKVVFSNTGNNKTDGRALVVNGTHQSELSHNQTAMTYTCYVPAGDVVLTVTTGDGGNMLNFTSVEFKAEDSYHRAVNPSYLGTLCWTNDAILGGATLYEFAGKNENNYLVFDEVEENRLEAGKPYIFMPENGSTEIKLYNTDAAAALEADQEPVNHMYGTIIGKTLVPGEDDNMYYFSSNHIWRVGDYNVNIPVPAYYCYIDYPAVLADEPAAAPAPGRRRVTMGVQGSQIATDIEDVQGDNVQCTKVLIDGQLFIIRGEKMFDVTGRLVK